LKNLDTTKTVTCLNEYAVKHNIINERLLLTEINFLVEVVFVCVVFEV